MLGDLHRLLPGLLGVLRILLTHPECAQVVQRIGPLVVVDVGKGQVGREVVVSLLQLAPTQVQARDVVVGPLVLRVDGHHVLEDALESSYMRLYM